MVFGTRGTSTPRFGLKGTVPLTFQDKKIKKLLLPAVNRSDLRVLNYNKTIFGQGSAPDPTDKEGNTSSPFSSLFARDLRAARSPSEWVKPTFWPKLRPDISYMYSWLKQNNVLIWHITLKCTVLSVYLLDILNNCLLFRSLVLRFLTSPCGPPFSAF